MADERKNVLPVIQQKWDPWKMYDISQSEQNAIKERAEKRMILKAEWQKKVSDPYIQSDIYENTTGAVVSYECYFYDRDLHAMRINFLV